MIVLLMGYNVTTCSDITQQKYSARRPGAGLGLGWGWAEVGLGLLHELGDLGEVRWYTELKPQDPRTTQLTVLPRHELGERSRARGGAA